MITVFVTPPRRGSPGPWPRSRSPPPARGRSPPPIDLSRPATGEVHGDGAGPDGPLSDYDASDRQPRVLGGLVGGPGHGARRDVAADGGRGANLSEVEIHGGLAERLAMGGLATGAGAAGALAARSLAVPRGGLVRGGIHGGQAATDGGRAAARLNIPIIRGGGTGAARGGPAKTGEGGGAIALEKIVQALGGKVSEVHGGRARGASPSRTDSSFAPAIPIR